MRSLHAGDVVRVAFRATPPRHALNAELLRPSDRDRVEWRELVIMAAQHRSFTRTLTQVLAETKGLGVGERAVRINHELKNRPALAVQVLTPNGMLVWIPAHWCEPSNSKEVTA